MTFSERFRLLGDDISYKYPRLRKYLKPIYHKLFYDRYMKERNSEFLLNSVEAMRQFDKCMNDNGITYSLAFGSILGAVREKGVIKHDNDMDTYVFIDENPRRVKECLLSYGFRLTRCFLVNDGDLGREETYEFKGSPIDIYWVYREKNGLCCSSFLPYADYPTLRISMKEVGKVQALHIKLPISEKVRIVSFGDLSLPIPANAEEFLSAYYGADYMQPNPNWDWRKCPMISYWNDAVATYDGVE